MTYHPSFAVVSLLLIVPLLCAMINIPFWPRKTNVFATGWCLGIWVTSLVLLIAISRYS